MADVLIKLAGRVSMCFGLVQLLSLVAFGRSTSSYRISIRSSLQASGS